MVLYAKDLILFFVYIDANIGNFRKNHRKNRGYTSKFTHISSGDCHYFVKLGSKLMLSHGLLTEQLNVQMIEFKYSRILMKNWKI